MSGEIFLPDTTGRWKTFALAPVSKSVMVHIAFDGEITDQAIKKAILFLGAALDWATPEPTQDGVLTPSIPPVTPSSDQSNTEVESND